MNARNRLVALPCKIGLGAFSGERLFTVTLANGTTYSSVASRNFCWNENGALVGENEPQSEVDGNLAARVVDWLDDDTAIVEVPDGEHVAVRREQVRARPSTIRPPEPNHVSLGSGS